MPALQGLLCGFKRTHCVPPPYHPYVISSAVLLGATKNVLVPQCSGTTECYVELILITSAFTSQHKTIRACFDVACQSIQHLR